MVYIFYRRYLVIKKKNSENVSTQKYYFEFRTQDLQIFKNSYMSQMNPKEFVHNTAFSLTVTLHSRSVPLSRVSNPP